MKFIPQDEALEIMLSVMNDGEKKEYLKLWWDEKYSEMHEIHETHGFHLPLPISEMMSDSDAEKVASQMANSPITNDEILKNIFDSMNFESFAESEKRSEKEIIEQLHFMDKKQTESDPMESYLNATIGDDAYTIMKAYCFAEISGCNNLKRSLMELYFKTIFNSYNNKAINILNNKKAISEDRRKAKKGKNNRHCDNVLEIARLTWSAYPHASLSGLSEEITAHLKSKWKDVPTQGTVERWLSKSEMNPDVKPKNRNFELVFPELPQN
ncbi:hypothetical protein L2C91_13485 [Rosenbergiella epipactidis]|uniref:hypothetical protein n=1 Tax=Rosenbergiella epipactidis TaxID=1544694 RepID=UPI0020270139|nr:hypothetical protein [Rosenbergiella epipactidis]MCL9669379.1 hypothetical protein [Rosenbergiella epipactidis]